MESRSVSLMHWLKSFSVCSLNDSVDDFSDGVIISKVLHDIDSSFFDETWLGEIKTDAGTNWKLKVINLKKILKHILDYYKDVISQEITGFHMPDLNAVAEKNDMQELGSLIQLILGCAVNCDRKREYIEALMALEGNIQYDLKNAIQELMMDEIFTAYQSEAYPDENNQLKGLAEDLHCAKISKAQITPCHEIDMQARLLHQQISKMIAELQKKKRRVLDLEIKIASLRGINEDIRLERIKINDDLHNLIEKIKTTQDLHAVEVHRIKKEDNETLQKIAQENIFLKQKIDERKKTSLQMNDQLQQEKRIGESLELQLINLKKIV